MSPVSDLPADQRAVLQLLLKQGQSYQGIAEMLQMDADTVRSRAHSAVASLGPESGARVSAERRGEIADYLLGQQDPADAQDTRDHLAGSAGARAWARVVAGELKPLAGDSLPEIPDEGAARTVVDEPLPDLDAQDEEFEEEEEDEEDVGVSTVRDGAAAAKPSSKLGGALLIGGLAILVAVLLIVLINGGSDDDDTPTTQDTAAQTTGTGATTTPAGQPQVVAQINLKGAKGSKAVGVAQVLIQGNQQAIALVGQDLEPSTNRAAYAVWLYTSPAKAKRLGFAPPVGKDGRLQGVAPLPTDAQQYKELVVTRETSERSQRPGSIVLRGPFTVENSGQ